MSRRRSSQGGLAASMVVAAILLPAPAAGAAEPPSDPLEGCRRQVRSAPEDYRSFACFWWTARATGNLDRAAKMMAELLEELPDSPHLEAYLAAVEMDRGRTERAAKLFAAAAEGHAQRGSTTAEAHVRLTFAYLLAVHQGRVDDAQRQIEEARSLMASVRDPSLPTWLALREVMVANLRLEFGRALHRLREVEATLFPDGPWFLRQLWFSSQGYTLRALGRYEAAYRAYANEAELLASHGAAFEEAIARRNLTLLAGLLGESRERRLELAAAALETARRGGNRRMEAQSHRDLSYLSEGETRLHHGEESLRIELEIGSPASIMEALRARALALAADRPDQAITVAGEAIRLAEQQRDPAQVAFGHMTLAEILRFTGPRDQALTQSLMALEMIEVTRRLQPDPEMRAAAFGTWTGPYYDLAHFLLSADEPPPRQAVAQAFAVMERMRARTLLDELQASRLEEPTAGQRRLLERRQATLLEIAAVQRRIFDRRTGETRVEEARQRLVELERQEAELREELGRGDLAFAALGPGGPVTLDDVQRALAPDQALLIFNLAPAGWRSWAHRWLLAISRSGVSVHRIPDHAWTSAALALFTGLIEGEDRHTSVAAAEIYGRLLAEAVETLGESVRRLVIVPDGPLHLLPFEALRRSPEEAPLGAERELVETPSASVWLRLRERAGVELQRSVFVVADPATETVPAAPHRGVAAPAWRVEGLGSLPFARREARAVRHRIGGDSRMLVGSRASERAFKSQERANAAIVHVAAHAVVDMEEHYRSGILLAAGAESEDGLLQIRELTDLDFSGQLVVLSACRTAGGPVLEGEGVMSLARPFLAAGASSVIGSLWPLPDRAAAELFDRFYERLSRGLSVSEAMSGARAEMARRGSPPRSWAGVVVLGDGDLVPLPGGRGSGRRWLAWALLVAVALVVGASLARRAFSAAG